MNSLAAIGLLVLLTGTDGAPTAEGCEASQIPYSCRTACTSLCADAATRNYDDILLCLYDNRHQEQMDTICHWFLTERAIRLGYTERMSHPISKACAVDFYTRQCVPQRHLDATPAFHVSYLADCLLNQALRTDGTLSKDCQKTVQNVWDESETKYGLSTAQWLDCARDIDEHCGGAAHMRPTTVRGCLQNYAANPGRDHLLTESCRDHFGETPSATARRYTLDRSIYDSCRQIIQNECASQEKQNATALLGCLRSQADKSGGTNVPAACRVRLVEENFFDGSSKWAFDQRIHGACHIDAYRRCPAFEDWSEAADSSEAKGAAGRRMLACMYRNSNFHGALNTPISAHCSDVARRVILSPATLKD